MNLRLSWTLVKLLRQELSLVVAGKSTRSKRIPAQLERVRSSIGEEIRRLSAGPHAAGSGPDTNDGARGH